jgi:hypothetical protein
MPRQKWKNNNATLTTKYGIETKPKIGLQNHLKAVKDMNEYSKLVKESEKRMKMKNPY